MGHPTTIPTGEALDLDLPADPVLADPVLLDFELSTLDPAYAADLRQSLGLHEHPFRWSLARKTYVLVFPFFAATLAAYAAGSYGAINGYFEPELSNVSFNLGITVFVLGFGLAPILLALVSELYGRYWVFVGAGTVFFFGTLGCALSQSLAAMLVSRLITGTGASVFATLTGGVVGDLFPKAQRNTPMALYSLAIIGGSGLGPLISGIAAQRLVWRWVFYLQTIFVGVATAGLLLCFRETRANVLLARNCKMLNVHIEGRAPGPDDTGLPSQAGRAEDPDKAKDAAETPEAAATGLLAAPNRFHAPGPDSGSLIATLGSSFSFPLKLLVTESIVFWFSAWVSFAWAMLYMQFSSIHVVYTNVYGFDGLQIGAIYATVITGAVVGCVSCIAYDRVLQRHFARFTAIPESRLYFSCFGSLLLPAGLFWFGFTARPDIHWMVPTVAIGTFEAGIFIIYLAVFNYFVDTYTVYASSALAAQSMCRNMLAGVFPLFTASMFGSLGYAKAGSLLGAIAVALSFVPWVLVFYGETIRKRSSFAQHLAGA
ncbi:hypothetical protein SCUCBS95973_006233 [Sporothrix curviconia]|uniref:Major facilitator superfamily (MFS) profile domain-containing protein n=1 Tax=Sporothrix curviconia TaxID=1260050 RepID=A0ABP0C3H2_9PEZI